MLPNVVGPQIADFIQHRLRAAFGQQCGDARIGSKISAAFQRQKESCERDFCLAFKRAPLAIHCVNVWQASRRMA